MFNKCCRDLLLLKIMNYIKIECEVNRSRELSVDSNMPPKKKMRTKDTHLVWTDDEVQLLSKENGCGARLGKHKRQI